MHLWDRGCSAELAAGLGLEAESAVVLEPSWRSQLYHLHEHDSDWPGYGHWDLPGDESLENVGVAAAQAWEVLAMIVVHPKEIEIVKMVVVEHIVDAVSLLHFGPLRWVPGERDVGR